MSIIVLSSVLLAKVCRCRTGSPQSSFSNNVCYLFRCHHGLIFVLHLFPHPLQQQYCNRTVSMEMSRLTRDETAEPVSRDQTLRRERRHENIQFPCSADRQQDWQPYRLILLLLYVINMHHTYMAKYTTATQNVGAYSVGQAISKCRQAKTGEQDGIYIYYSSDRR